MLEIQVFSPEIDKYLAKLRGLRGIIVANKILARVKENGKVVLDQIKGKYFSGRPGLNRQTGGLADSLFIKASIEKTDVIMKFDSKSNHLKSHIYGATITPKRASALAIPFNWAAPGGIPSYPSPLNRGEFFMVFSGGRAFLVNKAAKQISHTLKYSVTIPPRLRELPNYFHKVATPPIKEAASDIIRESLKVP